MAHASCRHFNSREAIAAATAVGWEVKPKRRSGEVEIIASDGLRYHVQYPGRSGDDFIPMRLRRLLSAALQALEK